jgi:hypothetical protein
MGAAMYAVENPNAKKLLSPDFFSCVLENIVPTNMVLML